jgi:hypothetical protein
MFCSNCGQPVSTGQRFCSSCGSVQATEPASLSPATTQVYPFTAPAGQKYLDVGGWILFFCLAHVVLGPVRLFSHLSAAPTATDWFYRFLTVFGIVVGVLLVTRTAYALEALKAYFLVAFLLNGIVLFKDMLGGSGSFDDSGIPFTARPVAGVVATVIWFLYFQNSQRVKATYGRNI